MNFAISRKNGCGIFFVLYALADVKYCPKYLSSSLDGGISKCFSPVADRHNFFRILAFITMSMLSFLGMSSASGCSGASSTWMSRSHLRKVAKMMIDIVCGQGLCGKGWTGEARELRCAWCLRYAGERGERGARSTRNEEHEQSEKHNEHTDVPMYLP